MIGRLLTCLAALAILATAAQRPNGTGAGLDYGTISYPTPYSISFWVFYDTAEGTGGRIWTGATEDNMQMRTDFGGGDYDSLHAKNFSTTKGIWRWAEPAGDTWTHYLIVYDCSSVSNDPVVYKDGSSITVTETQAPVGTCDTSQPLIFFNVASYGSASRAVHLAEWALYDGSLTAADAASLAAGFRAPMIRPGSLKMYMPLADALRRGDLITGTTPTLHGGVSAVHHPPVRGKR